MKFNFNKKLRCKSLVVSRKLTAETLLEVIIAVSIFALILGPASALFTSSIRTVAMNRNDLVASALAEEGIEMVRNMRDTNLLKFSPKAEECWNTKPQPEDPLVPITLENCSDSQNLIASGSYRLTLNPDTLEWDLISAPAGAETIESETYRLKSDIQGESAVPDCDAPGDPISCYNYTSLYFTTDDAVFASRGILSPFYRKISIEYVGDVMKIVAAVQYRSGSGVRTIQRGSVLTNHPN